jgi:hypothetical protein
VESVWSIISGEKKGWGSEGRVRVRHRRINETWIQLGVMRTQRKKGIRTRTWDTAGCDHSCIWIEGRYLFMRQQLENNEYLKKLGYELINNLDRLQEFSRFRARKSV